MVCVRSSKTISPSVGVLIAIAQMYFFVGLVGNAKGGPYPWPVTGSALPLRTSYGQHQKFFTGAVTRNYLHEGLDILKPAGTDVYASQKGKVIFKGSVQDTSDRKYYWTIAISNDSTYGFSYCHMDSADLKFRDSLGIDSLVAQGERIGKTVRLDIIGLPNHLHFEYDRGVYTIIPEPKGWFWMYPQANPLDSITVVPDTVSPYSILTIPVRDESQRAWGVEYRQKPAPDNRYVVDHRADVASYFVDRVDTTWSVGVYMIRYSVSGFRNQGLKGFKFSGPARFGTGGSIEEMAMASKVDSLVYLPGYGNDSLDYYLPSNTTDSLTTQFRDTTNLKGYWDTKHKFGGASGDTAIGNSLAEFSDGFYYIKVRGEDKACNIKNDSLQVIVNNFPPKIKQTYPDSCGVNFVNRDSIRIWFDQPMDTASAKAAFHLQLKGSGLDVAGDTLFIGDTLLIFAPSETLLLDTVYVVKIDATAKDIADSTMLNPYEFPFSTQKTVLLLSYYYGGQVDLRQYDSLATNPPLRTYDSHSGSAVVSKQRLCYDRAGNNFVIHSSANSDSDYVAKFSYTGTELGRFLGAGRKFHAITTDGDTLFLLRRTNISPDRYRAILKTGMAGDSGGQFTALSSGQNGWGLSYSVTDSLLYLGWHDSTSNRGYVRKYRRDGTPVGSDLQLPSSAHLRYPMVVVNDRLILVRSIQDQPLGDDSCNVRLYSLTNWNNSFSIDLNPHAPYPPWGSWVESATATPNYFYISVRTIGSVTEYTWIAVIDENGQWVRYLEPLNLENSYYGAITAFPSMLNLPRGSYTPPDNGDDGGGSQSAELNSLLPRVYALGPSFPNPACGGLKINYALPKESQVSLRVYNVMGQLVRSLREGKEKPGYYAATWDGKDQQGKRVSSGVYLYRMEAGEFRKTRKLIVVR